MNIKRLSCGLWLMVCPLVALSQWQWVAPYPPRLQAYSATVVGNRAYFWCAENLVLATIDGGQTFAVTQYSPSKDVALGCCNGHGIAFADSLTGYITDISYGQFRTTTEAGIGLRLGTLTPGLKWSSSVRALSGGRLARVERNGQWMPGIHGLRLDSFIPQAVSSQTSMLSMKTEYG